jgi:cleavage and polyadenylation specificity factor subunit 1
MLCHVPHLPLPLLQSQGYGLTTFTIDFSLEQIIPAIDETTGVELKNIGASFCDPYMLLFRDDSSIALFQVNGTGELEELERGDGILKFPWLSASVYKSSATNGNALVFGLTAEGGLRVGSSVSSSSFQSC